MSNFKPVPGKIPGTTINLSGCELVLAPLNLDGVQAFEPLQKELAAATSIDDVFDVTSRILLLSLSRNYPDITAEDIRALLDTVNARVAMEDLAKLSGMRVAKSGELVPASP